MLRQAGASRDRILVLVDGHYQQVVDLLVLLQVRCISNSSSSSSCCSVFVVAKALYLHLFIFKHKEQMRCPIFFFSSFLKQ